MAWVVVYDACVLHPAPLRDLLLRVARAGFVRARWTDEILDEWLRSLLRERPDLDAAKLRRTRRLMIEAVPDCLVHNYARLVDAVELPDPADRHVLAAAIAAGAQTIVTSNLRDFPAAALAAYGVVAQHPDEFLLDLCDLYPEAFLRALREQAAALRSPPMTVADVLAKLEATGARRLVAEVRRLRRRRTE